MAIYNEDIVNIDLNSGTIFRGFANKCIGEGDAEANRYGVRVFRGGVPENIGGTCVGFFVRPDGGTVVIDTGVVSGNVAYVTLPSACYAVEGQFSLAIKCQGGDVTGTVRIVDGTVSNTTTQTIVDPGTVLPSIEDLIEAIDEAVASIPADYSALWATIAPTFSAGALYGVGDYVTYNGGLYRFTAEHAGSWSSGDVVAVSVGGDLAYTRYVSVEAERECVFSKEIKVVFTSGKYVNPTNGNLAGSEHRSYSDYIDISGHKKIQYTMIHWTSSITSGGGVAFYNSSKVFISGVRNKTDAPESAYNALYVADVPDGAKYARFTYWGYVDQKNVEPFRLFVQQNEIKENLATAARRARDVSDYVFGENRVINGTDIYLWAKGFIQSDGTDAPYDTAIKSGYVEADQFFSVTYTGIERYNNTPYYFFAAEYDDSFAFIQRKYILSDTGKRVYTPSENCKYVRFCLLHIHSTDVSIDVSEASNVELTMPSIKTQILASPAAESDNSLFYAENLKGLPILNSFGDINITTEAYNDCAAFHSLMNTELVSASNGYITRELLGDDGHGNNLYVYTTHPKDVVFGTERHEGSPVIPPTGGIKGKVFTVLITSNIHGRERNGNWVIYNLLKKVLSENSDMLRFFRNRVRLIWIPYICASGDYENADGININRDFPTTKAGTCQSNEATYIKSVVDNYGSELDLHIDAHTYNESAIYASSIPGWVFTDSNKLGERAVVTCQAVLDEYARKYPSIDNFTRQYFGATNTTTTCTYYTQTVYGVPAGTMEAVLTMSGSPTGADEHTSATAYFYDMLTQTICAMA